MVTLWQEVPRLVPQPTGTELGSILRRIHTLTPPSDLPTWNPLDGIRTRLADAEELTEDDHSFLVAACDELAAALTAVEYTLPPALVHGDATVANLIPGPDGPVICDFDSTSYGPAEWDLTPVAVGQLRFANNTNNQALLAASHGFDITTWPGFPVFRRLRELQLVTSVVPVLRSNPELQPQWRHRLETFRNGDTQARWELYK
jgi:aminoglycoside phosphotransferase (APT) family kinase protein